MVWLIPCKIWGLDELHWPRCQRPDPRAVRDRVRGWCFSEDMTPCLNIFFCGFCGISTYSVKGLAGKVCFPPKLVWPAWSESEDGWIFIQESSNEPANFSLQCRAACGANSPTEMPICQADSVTTCPQENSASLPWRYFKPFMALPKRNRKILTLKTVNNLCCPIHPNLRLEYCQCPTKSNSYVNADCFLGTPKWMAELPSNG